MATVVTRAGKGINLTPTEADANFTNINTELMAATTNVASQGTAISANTTNIASNTTAISNKQSTLVSGTNIKTVNGTSILGAGDVAISGGAANTDALTEGTTNLYFTNVRAIAAPATGVSFVDLTAPTATSTILQFLGKLWGNILANATAISTKKGIPSTPAAHASVGTVTVTFDTDKIFPSVNQTGDITFVTNMTGAVNGAEVVYLLNGDNVHSITTPSGKIGTEVADNTKQVYIVFRNLNGIPKYVLTNTLVPDTAPPVLVSTSSNRAGTILTFKFNELLSGQTISVKKNGAAITGSISLIVDTVGFIPTVAGITGDVFVINGTATDNFTNVLTLPTDTAVNTSNIGGLLVSDGFNSANTSNINGRNPDIGASAWIKVDGDGTLGIVSNAAKLTSGTYGTYMIDATEAPVEWAFELGIANTTQTLTAFYALYTDAGNYLAMDLTGKIKQKFGGGTETVIYAGSGTSGNADILKLVRTGSTSVSIYRNGTLLGTATISSTLNGLKSGLIMYTDSITSLNTITVK